MVVGTRGQHQITKCKRVRCLSWDFFQKVVRRFEKWMFLSESAMPLKLKEYMKGSALSPVAMFVLIFLLLIIFFFFSSAFGLSRYLMVHRRFIKKKKVHLCFSFNIVLILKVPC